MAIPTGRSAGSPCRKDGMAGAGEWYRIPARRREMTRPSVPLALLPRPRGFAHGAGKGRGIEADGIGRGEAGLVLRAAHRSARGGLIEIVCIETNSDHLRGKYRTRSVLVQRDQVDEGRDLHPRRAAVVV